MRAYRLDAMGNTGSGMFTTSEEGAPGSIPGSALVQTLRDIVSWLDWHSWNPHQGSRDAFVPKYSICGETRRGSAMYFWAYPDNWFLGVNTNFVGHCECTIGIYKTSLPDRSRGSLMYQQVCIASHKWNPYSPFLMHHRSNSERTSSICHNLVARENEMVRSELERIDSLFQNFCIVGWRLNSMFELTN